MTEGSSNAGWRNLAMVRLHHFLYLGTEGNCYHPDKRQFSLDSVHSIELLIDNGNGIDVVNEVVRFFKEGYSVYPDALIYALAVCAHSKDKRTKMAGFKAAEEVCSSAASMFAFTRFYEEVSRPSSGWGRAHRTAVSEWYNSKSVKELAAEVTKVKSRHRWNHKDILRLAHVKPEKIGTAAVFKYVLKSYEAAQKEHGTEPEAQDILTYLKSVHELKHTTDHHVAARLIEIHDLCYEHIPTPLLKSKEVWACLIPRLPLHNLLQQLPRLSKLGLLKHNSPLLKALLERLRSESALTDGHLGPLETFLIARHCEITNKVLPGKPIPRQRHPQLDEALNNLHLASFKMVPSTGKRYLVAIDVRGTMVHGRTAGCPNLSPADASAIILMALARAEVSNVFAVGFSTKGMTNIDINNKMTLADITRRMRETPIGPVNMAAPLQWAQEKKKAFDVIIICTDNQTLPGDIHPADALKEYRKALNLPNARFIVCAMCSRGFSLAPPDEPGMLDIAGFSAKMLQIIQDFARGVF